MSNKDYRFCIRSGVQRSAQPPAKKTAGLIEQET
jgi:hypothetical protein